MGINFEALQRPLVKAADVEGRPAQPPAIQRPPATVIDIMRSNEKRLLSAAPNDYKMTIARLEQTYVTEAKKNPMLAKCDPYSVVGAIMLSQQLGLEIGGTLGLAYLVPFNDHKNGPQCQLIIGYQGMMDLAWRSGLLVSIEAEIVYEADDFDYYLKDFQKVIHWVPMAKGKDKTDDKIKAVVAWAKLVGGGVVSCVLFRDDVIESEKKHRKGRDMSRPWRDNFASMARKTAIRRLFTFLPKSIQIKESLLALAHENRDMRAFAEETLENVTPKHDVDTQPMEDNGDDAGADE